MNPDALDIPATVPEKIEDAILALLKNGMTDRFLIEGFPDNPDDFDVAGIERAALVHYVGSKFTNADAITAGESKRALVFGIHLYIRSTGAEDAARKASYRAIEDARLALQGQHVQGGVLAIVSDELAEQDGGLWHWVIEVAIAVRAVPIRRQMRPLIKSFNERENVA